VREVFQSDGIVTLLERQPLKSLVEAIASAPDSQDSFPVLDAKGKLCGIVSGDVLRSAVQNDSPGMLIIAADVMLPAVQVGLDDDLHTALERFLGSDLHEIPVIEDGKVVGLLDQAHITRAYHDYLGRLAGDGSERLSALPPSRPDLSK